MYYITPIVNIGYVLCSINTRIYTYIYIHIYTLVFVHTLQCIRNDEHSNIILYIYIYIIQRKILKIIIIN